MLNYTAIDFETANSFRGSPCSVGLVRVRDGAAAEKLHLLIRPPAAADWFDQWNISLHGITPEAVTDAPRWKEALPTLVDFVGNDVVIAHNAGFDIGVIRYACAADGIDWPEMRFLCTMVLARHSLALPSYQLPYVVEALGANLDNHHDAMADSLAVVDVTNRLSALRGVTDIEALAASVGVTIGEMRAGAYKGSVVTSSGGRAALVRSDLNPDADPEGYLYGRVVVFTGKLMSMTRQVAWDECSKVGAIAERGTTKRTNVLVVGDINPASLRPGTKLTSKAMRAFELQDQGQAIEVMTERDFLNCLDGTMLDGSVPDWLLNDTKPDGRARAATSTANQLRSVPLADRPAAKAPSKVAGPRPLRREHKPTDQQCSFEGCRSTAAFRTRSRPTWCLEHIGEIYRTGGLVPLESFTHPDDWILTECLSCAVQAHYRFAYVLDKNAHREPVCRACFWRQWARQSRALRWDIPEHLPTDYDENREFIESNGFDYLGPLTAPSYAGDPHHTRCRRCGKISAERLSDIGFGCTCIRRR